jgi:hypothetical protein
MRTTGGEVAMAEKIIQVGTHTRTLKQREVTYTCQFPYCEQTITELRYPGPTPHYCAFHKQQQEQWRRQDDRDAAAERMRRLREQRRMASQQSH